MAAIPESTRSSVALRLLDHAEQHWPQLHRVQVTSRAGFAYVTGISPRRRADPTVPAALSEKAAVRIGGLTDLERLGQAYPELRQMVIDRICAYLREPFEPSLPWIKEDLPADEIGQRLELEVRWTGQNILKRHLRWRSDVDELPETFWKDIHLSLRDAKLVGLDLRQCRVASADFRRAVLSKMRGLTALSLVVTRRCDSRSPTLAGSTTVCDNFLPVGVLRPIATIQKRERSFEISNDAIRAVTDLVWRLVDPSVRRKCECCLMERCAPGLDDDQIVSVSNHLHRGVWPCGQD